MSYKHPKGLKFHMKVNISLTLDVAMSSMTKLTVSYPCLLPGWVGEDVVFVVEGE